jgi:hypothetical protein
MGIAAHTKETANDAYMRYFGYASATVVVEYEIPIKPKVPIVHLPPNVQAWDRIANKPNRLPVNITPVYTLLREWWAGEFHGYYQWIPTVKEK